MAIKLRSKREIEMLRRAGAIVADVLSKLQEQVRPGISTGELDEISSEMAESAGAVPLFRGVKGPYSKKAFPGSICASINEQVVHGIPSRKVTIKAGDMLSIDFGVKVDGYCGDAAVTVGIGEVSEDRQKLMDVTKKLLDTAISRVAPGVKWSEIAGEMESCAASAGFSVVKDFVGHGIGTEMHEDPKVPNFVSKELRRNDIILKEGMVLAIEPMVNMGTSDVRTLKDGWVVVTKDGKCSAHFEHTVAVVKSGCEVLTLRQ
jgi:methionyl aminopeptidase